MKNEMKTEAITLPELEEVIKADFEALQARNEKKETIEACLFFICFAIGAALMVAKVLVDLAPWIVAFPSAKTMVFRMFGGS